MEYEVKYVYKAWHSDYVRRQLEQLCKKDSEYSQNIVNSIYFDTSNWAFSMDKASSDYLKTKVRVRWYTNQFDQHQSSTRFLEIKRKIGSTRGKTRLQLSEEFDDFCANHYTGAQLKQLSELILQLEPALHRMALAPALQISYHRRRFTESYSNSRLALDTLIRGRALSYALGYGHRSIVLSQSVLEVKSNKPNLPQALRTPLSGLITKAAFSKYFECFEQLSGYQQ